jgi:hypothetical protein
VAGIRFQNLPVDLLRLRQASGLMMFNGKGKWVRDVGHLLFSPHWRLLIVRLASTKTGSIPDSSDATAAANHVRLLFSVKTLCTVN